MSHYLMRSGRLVKIFTKSGDVYTIIDSENGYSNWRMSTAVVKVSFTVVQDLLGFKAQTESGSTYQIINYSDICTRNTLDRYIESNPDLSHYEIIARNTILGE